MRTLLLASAAALALAASPALADSLLSGGAKVGADAGVGAHVGGSAANVGTSGVGVQADGRTAVDAGAATGASAAATDTADSAPASSGVTNAATGVTGVVANPPATAADLQNSQQSSAQSVFAAGQLIGKTVVDANGQTVGEVSNAVLTTDAHAVSQIVIASGGFLGIGAREVAVDAASVDASAASQGTVQLRGLTEADLNAMAEFQADGSVRLLNPS
jgi:sporulation protein YlmC with PRC-barrel domain